jgi:hypothetical protein
LIKPIKENAMNPIDRMTKARQVAEPQRKNEIDEVQYLFDKAQQLADRANAPAEVTEPTESAPAESEAARRARLIGAMTQARGGAKSRSE